MIPDQEDIARIISKLKGELLGEAIGLLNHCRENIVNIAGGEEPPIIAKIDDFLEKNGVKVVKKKNEFEPGDKVVFKGETYDFGYYSQTYGKCVIYIEGCKNMQDSYAVNISAIKHKKGE